MIDLQCGLLGASTPVLCQEYTSEAEAVVAKIDVAECGPKEKASK